MRHAFLLLLWCVLAGHSWADEVQVLPDELEGGPTNQLLTRHLQQLADVAFARRKVAYEAIKSADDAVAYQKRVRNLLLAQLGPLPERTPLEARIVGSLKGDGYRAEKLIFESQPRHHVTAVLFLPTQGEPPYPAVLIPCGHSSDGKASQQRMCILLANSGIAAMSYDPIGQGERHQLLDEQGKPRLKITDEHTLLGATSILVGRNTATYRVWDGIRAIDYLVSRDDIDEEKIGVTGCSGGGTLTSYLMALDDRVACAAPSCYITSFPRLLATIGPQDAEQNIHAQIALGIDHADYLHLRAPRPTLILASTRDFFDIEGTWHSYREAKRFYTRLGYPERVSLVETDAQHGFPKQQREAMASWMSRWLLGRDQVVTETDFATHSAAEMQCTPRGEVLFIDGARSVVDLNLELAEKLKLQRAEWWREENRQNALAEVRRLTGVRPLEALPPVRVREAGTVDREGYSIVKLVLEAEGRVPLPALLFRPAKATGHKVLYLHGLGKHVDAGKGGPIEELVRGGNLVLTVDLAGCGETGTSEATMLGANWNDVFISYLLGRPLVGIRAEDTLIAARYLSELPWNEEDSRRLRLVAIQAAGPPALHAVALEGAMFDELELRDLPPQWSEYLRDPTLAGQMVSVVHGALAVYDFSDLIDSLDTKKFKVVQDPAH
jgi:dienelactone hydrolase